MTGLMAAVLCILGPVSLPLPFSPVPMSGDAGGLSGGCHTRRASGNRKLRALSSSGTCGTSCLFRICGRSGKAFRSDRRVSDGLSVSGDDSRNLARKGRKGLEKRMVQSGRNVAWNADPLRFWHTVAGVVGRHELLSGSLGGRSAVYTGRSFENGSCTFAWRKCQDGSGTGRYAAFCA